MKASIQGTFVPKMKFLVLPIIYIQTGLTPNSKAFQGSCHIQGLFKAPYEPCKKQTP
jgi:hypothetical protein